MKVPLRISRELLGLLRTGHRGIPLQGLLLGSRSIASNGLFLTAARMVPFENVGSHLATLISHYLDDKSEETIVGWCLLVDRECQMIRIASAYFDCFYRQVTRTIIANLAGKINTGSLAEELYDFLSPMTGLIVVRDISDSHLTREFCGYKGEISIDDCLSLINETCITKLDLFASVNASSVSYHGDMDGVTALAIDELMDQLRAEFLEDSETSSPKLDNDAPRQNRKTRKKRQSLAIDGLMSPFHGRDELSARKSRSSNIVPCEIEISTGTGAEFYGILASPNLVLIDNKETLNASILMKEARIRQISEECLNFIDCYTQSCYEYELLSLVYKVLSQPDEVILRKLDNLEDYEERMKKLGAKLKHSLSPEDLLRTLASIKPSYTQSISSSSLSSFQ